MSDAPQSEHDTDQPQVFSTYQHRWLVREFEKLHARIDEMLASRKAEQPETPKDPT